MLTRGTVTINAEQCKGCELCIPACRPGVLRMGDSTNTHGFLYPELMPGCTGCRACHDVCPDFVFDVFKFTTPIEIEDNE
jgi:2-oxoglutarate ferredoxin oxidoreductase subunit delta